MKVKRVLMRTIEPPPQCYKPERSMLSKDESGKKKNQRGKAGFINKTNGSLGSNRLALVLCWFKHPFLCSPCRGIVQRENRFYDPDTRSPSILLSIGNHNHRPPRNGIK